MSASAAPHKGLGGAFANLFTANLASSLGDGIARTADSAARRAAHR